MKHLSNFFGTFNEPLAQKNLTESFLYQIDRHLKRGCLVDISESKISESLYDLKIDLKDPDQDQNLMENQRC